MHYFPLSSDSPLLPTPILESACPECATVSERLTTGVAGWTLCGGLRGRVLLGIPRSGEQGGGGAVVPVPLGAGRVLGGRQGAARGHGAEGAEGEDGGVVGVAGRRTAAGQVLGETEENRFRRRGSGNPFFSELQTGFEDLFFLRRKKRLLQ